MSYGLKATNDKLINDLLTNPLYKIIGTDIFTMVCKTGKVSSKGIWRKLNFVVNKSGYPQVSYKYKKLSVHRIMYGHYNGKLIDTMVVNHKDGNRLNFNPENLELISQSMNSKKSNHKIVSNKLNYKLAEEIRKKNKSGISFSALSKEYKISKSTISYVVNFKIWKEEYKYGRNNFLEEATPEWQSRKELKDFWNNCPNGMVVDHIIPLNHESVCGLNVISNLQYLSPIDNSNKSNSFDFSYDNNSWKTKTK